MAYETILVETRGKVGLVTLNRPKALNALNAAALADLLAAFKAFDADPGIAAVVLTGSEKAFAAGAGIIHRCHLLDVGARREGFFRTG